MNYSQIPHTNIFVHDVNDDSDRHTKDASALSQMEMISQLNNRGVVMADSAANLTEATQFFRRALQKADQMTFFAGALAQLTTGTLHASKNQYIYQRGDYDEGMHTFSAPIMFDANVSISAATATIL